MVHRRLHPVVKGQRRLDQTVVRASCPLAWWMGTLPILQHEIRSRQRMHTVQPDHIKGQCEIEPHADDRRGCGGPVVKLTKGGDRSGADKTERLIPFSEQRIYR